MPRIQPGPGQVSGGTSSSPDVTGAGVTFDTVNGRVGFAGNTTPAVPVDVGTGSDVQFYTTVPAQLGRYRHGTTAAPVATPGPSVRVSRTEQLSRAQIEAVGGAGTDGGEQCAAIIGLNSGTAATEVQPVGVYGGAKTASTSAVATNDACGLYGAGRALDGSTGTGIGAFLIGRRETTGRACGLEVHVRNGGAATAYSPTVFPASQAIWLNASGTAASATAININNAFGQQFDVGLAFGAMPTGGLTGGVKTASISDDSTSATSIRIGGTHATAAITVAPGAGKVGIGTVTPGSLLHVAGGDAEVSGAGKGVILPAPDGTRWRVTVDNTGRLATAVAA